MKYFSITFPSLNSLISFELLLKLDLMKKYNLVLRYLIKIHFGINLGSCVLALFFILQTIKLLKCCFPTFLFIAKLVKKDFNNQKLISVVFLKCKRVKEENKALYTVFNKICFSFRT